MNVAETRKQLEKRMDEAARKYAETHDEKYKEEPLELAHELTDGRARRVKDYEAIARHVLKTRVGQQAFGKLALGLLNVSQLQTLQTKLKSKGLKANSVNGIIHSCLRAMLRDARVDGLIKTNLYDRDFFPALPLTDTKKSINPYKPEERETILEAFRTKRPHYYRFVFFQFWQGSRPSEAIALRRSDIDLPQPASLKALCRVMKAAPRR